MQLLLQILSSVGPKSSVPDTVFAAVGALANAIEEDFLKYMDSFSNYLYNALGNQEEPAICAMAIGLVSDVSRALNDKIQPYCDTLMNYLLNNLRVRCLFLLCRGVDAKSSTESDARQPVQASNIAVLW